MEVVLTVVIYVLNRWWLFLPLVIGINLLLSRFFGLAFIGINDWTQRAGIIIAILLMAFIGPLTAPLINYYGEYAIAKVESKRDTMLVDATYNKIVSVKASFIDNEGRERKLSYWDNVWRVYPILKGYGIPMSKGQYFVIKYLPLKPSEFVFMAELSEQDRKDFCPDLLNELAETKSHYAQVNKELSELSSSLHQGLTREQRDDLRRKLARAKDLTEAEQKYNELSEQGSYLDKKIKFLETTLSSEDYCDYWNLSEKLSNSETRG